MNTESPLFARQPIFDRNNNVVAYELLFRHSDANYAKYVDGDHASSHVLLNVFGSQSLEHVLGDKKAFINYTRNLLISPPPLPQKQIVIEVLEDIEADEKIIAGLKKLKEDGYEIALDDFFLNRDTKKMLRYADIIKVDVLAVAGKRLEKYVEILKPLNLKLLAEKIEDYSMLETCKALGFDYFQGYFLCKPEIIRGARVTASRQSALRLIATLNDVDVVYEKLVETISTDPGLSYKILKLVNSPAIGVTTKIESLAQAVTLLGLNQIKNWATFLLMASSDDKPKELCVITMCRAKLCELAGRAIGNADFGQSCFTIGLLSNLDSFLNMNLSDLVAQLKLSEKVENALLNKLGDEGQLLFNVCLYERGNWAEVDWEYLASKNILPEQMNEWYMQSISWAINLVQSTQTR